MVKNAKEEPPYERMGSEQLLAATRPPIWRRAVDSFKPMEFPAETPQPPGNPEDPPQKLPDRSDMGLKRALTNRHIQMIAFGGAIGTGLFIGSGGVLASGGPASVLIGFILIGSMLFNVVMALGEMAVLYPIAGSFNVYCSRFIDPAWGFAIGWNYALQWLVTVPLELTAAAITINYWGSPIDSRIYITIVLFLVICINFFGVKGYGEAEFLFSMIKIIAVIGFIILSVVIDVGGGPRGSYLGAETWVHPGAFNNGFQGFCSVFVTAAFAFGGAEMVGLAAAESAEPRKTLPKATKQVFWRITLFYVVTLFLIGLIVPYDDPRLLGQNATDEIAASPFVIAIDNAGIKVLPSIFNGVILVSVLSVGNSAVYGASRTLCALAQQGQAPKILGYVDREGRPLASIVLSLLFGCIAYINGEASSEVIFSWLLAISGLSTVFTWLSICWAHLRFRSAWIAQGHTLEELPFKAALGLLGSWWGLIFNALVLVAQFYISLFPIGESATVYSFFQAYLAFPVLILSYVFWKLWKKTPFMVSTGGRADGFSLLHTETMDLDTGRRDMDLAAILKEERAEHALLPMWKRFYKSLCG